MSLHFLCDVVVAVFYLFTLTNVIFAYINLCYTSHLEYRGRNVAYFNLSLFIGEFVPVVPVFKIKLPQPSEI